MGLALRFAIAIAFTLAAGVVSKGCGAKGRLLAADLTKLTTSSYHRSTSIMNYDEKFAGLIRLCESEKSRGAEFLMVTHPQVLGDTYEELVESLNRIADAGLMISIEARSERGPLPGGPDAT